jgi:hypothetical protein
MTSVKEHAPARPGIYGISNAAEWLYIGSSDNIRDALLGLLRASSSLLQGKRPSGFVFELCDQPGRAGRQHRLVAEYQPVCNRQ